MPQTRRACILGVAALPLVAIGRALAADAVLKFSNNLPASHPLNRQVAAAAERIAVLTGGRVRITMHPDSALGTDTETLPKLRTGEIEMLSMSASIVSNLVPAASINGIGFAFQNYDQVWAAMDGKLGAWVRSEMLKQGVTAVGRMWNNGLRQVTTSTKPVRTPEDLHGMKLRVPVSPLWMSTFTALGAAPVGMNFALLHDALKDHALDAQENSLAVIQTSKLFEVQEYCSLTNHIWDGYWLMANVPAMARLSRGDRDILEGELDRAAVEERGDLNRINPALRSDLAMTGMRLNAVDNSPFKSVLLKSGYYKEWRGKFGDAAWRLLEDQVGALS